MFWKPIYNILEGEMEALLVNAQHIKAAPGRKTDVKDTAWIAGLLQHGLLRASFVPPRPQRDLRELTRTRKTLIEERARVVNHTRVFGAFPTRTFYRRLSWKRKDWLFLFLAWLVSAMVTAFCLWSRVAKI